MVRLINAPFDRCGPLRGSALGPQALYLAGLYEALSYQVQLDPKSPTLGPSVPSDTVGINYFEEALGVYHEMKALVGEALTEGVLPVILGGDHSLSIATGSAALEHTNCEMALLWVDAHADANTAGTSPSANLHGMPIGALTRHPHRIDAGLAKPALQEIRKHQAMEWERLLEEVVPKPGLAPSRIAWIGLREVDRLPQTDLDPGAATSEREIVEECRKAGAFVTSMHEVDRYGIMRVMTEFRRWLAECGTKNLYVSFDVDAFDPTWAPGTGTMVRGGLSYREGHFIAEVLHQMVKSGEVNLIGLDVVETNTLLDHNNVTATIAVEWVSSFFGKTILMDHPTWKDCHCEPL